MDVKLNHFSRTGQGVIVVVFSANTLSLYIIPSILIRASIYHLQALCKRLEKPEQTVS